MTPRCPNSLASWRRDLILFGALLVLLFGLGYVTLVELVARIEDERTARVEAAAELVERVCQRDNAQDTVLAHLVRTSIAASESPLIDAAFTRTLVGLERRVECRVVVRRYIEELRE